MKTQVWAAVFVGLAFLGCQEIDGECWPVTEDGQGTGAGGGPILPGSGGYGVSPEPMASGDSPPPGCDSQVFDVEACKRKCDRKAAAAHKKCGKMPPGPERAKCRQVAEEQRGYCYGDCERKKGD